MNEGLKLTSKSSNAFDPIHDIESDHLGRYPFAKRILSRVSASDCSALSDCMEAGG
jgi:hypothetical protein